VCVRQQFDTPSCQWNPTGTHYYTPYFLQVNDVCSKACCVHSVKENMADITVLKYSLQDSISGRHTSKMESQRVAQKSLSYDWTGDILEIAVHVLDWKLRYNKLRTRIAWNHKTPTVILVFALALLQPAKHCIYYSRTPLIWKLVVHIATYPVRLGTSG
jgi:hypothetical protein